MIEKMALKLRIFSAGLAVSVILGLAGPLAAQSPAKVEDVTIGEKYAFTSSLLKGEIPVRIHLPPGYQKSEAPFPVLYLLEIADDFVFASAAADFLAQCGRIPALIVVSVDVDKVTGPPPAMIGFLDKELIPFVQSTYRATTQRIFYGHSGRSFAGLYIMLNRPELFEAFICPGLGLSWPVEKGRLDFAALFEDKLPQLKPLPKALVFSLGDEPKFFAGVDRFVSVLKAKAPAGLRWTNLRFPEDDHSSTKLKTLYQGLEFVFSPAGK